jgi:hypothetical protein
MVFTLQRCFALWLLLAEPFYDYDTSDAFSPLYAGVEQNNSSFYRALPAPLLRLSTAIMK